MAQTFAKERLDYRHTRTQKHAHTHTHTLALSLPPSHSHSLSLSLSLPPFPSFPLKGKHIHIEINRKAMVCTLLVEHSHPASHNRADTLCACTQLQMFTGGHQREMTTAS